MNHSVIKLSLNKFLFIGVLIFFAGCSSKDSINKKRQIKIFAFSKSEVKNIDSTSVLDSIRIISLDTITDNDLIFMRFNRVQNIISKNIQIMKLKQEQTLNYLQLSRLSSEISSGTYLSYKEDANKLIKEVKEYLKQDSINRITLDSLSIQLTKADTTIMRYIEIKSLRQYHRTDLSVVRDTVFNVFDTMENLVRIDDIK